MKQNRNARCHPPRNSYGSMLEGAHSHVCTVVCVDCLLNVPAYVAFAMLIVLGGGEGVVEEVLVCGLCVGLWFDTDYQQQMYGGL